MASTVVGFDGLRVHGAFGVRAAIVDLGNDRVRVEREVPIELERETFEKLAEERRVTRLTGRFHAREEKAVVVYVDWDAACDSDRQLRQYFGHFLTGESTERIDDLLPSESRTAGRHFRLLVRDRASAAAWADRLFDDAFDQFKRNPPARVSASWKLIQWLEFVVPYTTGQRERRERSVYAWLLALAKTGEVPNVRPENVLLDLELQFAPDVRRRVAQQADTIFTQHLSARPTRRTG